MKKEMNNKGFSLVELIVVIAIMAVLVGVLAPQFLRYVERSRLQKDNQAIAEIANAAKAAAATEKGYEAIGSGTTISATGKTYQIGTSDAFFTEIQNTVGSSVALSSKTYTAAPALVVKTNATTGTVEVTTSGWIEETGTTATGKTF